MATKTKTKKPSNLKKIKEDLVHEAYLVLDNESVFYRKIQQRMKEKNKVPTLVELDKLVMTGYNKFVKQYIEPTERKYFDEKVCRAVAKKLLIGYKEEFDYNRKYKK